MGSGQDHRGRPRTAARPRLPRLNTLQLRHVLDDGGATVRPYIDGADLLAGYRYDRGLDPGELLPPESDRLLPQRAGRYAVVGSCSCGVVGCGRVGLVVRRVRDTVVWEPASGTTAETIRRDYRFALLDYLDAVDRAADDRPVEGRGRRVARLITVALADQRQSGSGDAFRGIRVDWVSAYPWESSAVQVSISGRDGRQHLREYPPGPSETDAGFADRVLAALWDEMSGLDRA